MKKVNAHLTCCFQCLTSNDCRCGKVAMSCNAIAKKCQVVITPDELQRSKANLKPVDRTSDRARPSIPNRQCSKQSRQGDPVSRFYN